LAESVNKLLESSDDASSLIPILTGALPVFLDMTLTPGSTGADVISGGEYRDVILGNKGNDQLSGSAGHDILMGGKNNDRLSGGTGNDRLDGGGGADTFIFNRGDGYDTIAN